MQRFLIQCVNCALLAIVFLGIPAATGEQFWEWRISSVPLAHELMLWGLALAAGGNMLAAGGLIKGRKERKLCWEWTGVFIGLLLVQYACNRGYFNFNWLKQILLWLQNHFWLTERRIPETHLLVSAPRRKLELLLPTFSAIRIPCWQRVVCRAQRN
jgi:hypothetical protein